MHILTILILLSLVTAEIFDLFKRQECDIATCDRSKTKFKEYCDVNDENVMMLKCICEDLPDSYFEDLHDCAVYCQEQPLMEVPGPSGIRDFYCGLASQSDLSAGLDEGINFTEVESDSESGSETTTTGSESESSMSISNSKTVDSTTTNSGTSSSGATSTETSSAETSSFKSATTSKTTIVNGAVVINCSLFSCIALMIAMLI